jgi:hypothetical protein
MPTVPSSQKSRLGFHYYPDLNHYRESDLRSWVPKLQSLGASWLTLLAPSDRAIPESFISGLVGEGIDPVLHFPISLATFPTARDLAILFNMYNRWGIKYVVLFDRPNNRSQWPTDAWARTHLVERFLDHYIPLAEIALHTGLTPVFPPLEPGGDYWDTAFLRAALESIKRRGHNLLLDHLVLGAYAQAGERPLNWGSGGPECWPSSKPYNTPPGEEDQCGFHIFDWYLSISAAAVGKACPMLLFQVGSRMGERPHPKTPPMDVSTHSLRNLAIAKALAADSQSNGMDPVDQAILANMSPIPEQVLGAHLWLLSSAAESKYCDHSWFNPDGSALPIVESLQKWHSKHKKFSRQIESLFQAHSLGQHTPHRPAHPIAHYLLLPTYEWGVADTHLDLVRSFIKKHQPTVGFSLDEAARAERVTIVGEAHDYPDGVLDNLRASGVTTDYLAKDGTSIASGFQESSEAQESSPVFASKPVWTTFQPSFPAEYIYQVAS